MQNRYKIYPQINFGISKLVPREQSIEELLELAETFRKDKDFPAVNYQLTDMRGCSFNFNANKIIEMKLLMDNYKNIDNQKLGVYLVDQPLETAYIMLFFKSIEYKREFCSTVEKAYNLLSLPISLKDFEKLINI
jgi:hypothetical protein